MTQDEIKDKLKDINQKIQQRINALAMNDPLFQNLSGQKTAFEEMIVPLQVSEPERRD